MIRISQQQQGEMFSNTIFTIFNNQHRHCNIVHRWMQSYKNMQQSATVLAVHCSSEYNHIKIPQPPIYNTQNIYNWKQCNWQHANTTERCSIWYILYNNQPQCLSHIYKELSVKISITEWQCILKPTVIASKKWFEHWGGSLHTQQDVLISFITLVSSYVMQCIVFFFQANTNWSAIGNHTKTDTKWAGLYV